METQIIKSSVVYDPVTGSITCAKTGANLVKTNSKGGCTVRLGKNKFPAAKVAYLCAHNYYPSKRGEVVFLDGDKTNLRLQNLQLRGLTKDYLSTVFDYSNGVLTKNGYPVVSSKVLVNNKSSPTAHIVWILCTGEVPKHITFKDGNQNNICINNLQSRDFCLRTDNTSGYPGVCWSSSANKWVARIGGKYLGIYEDKASAISARRAAEER